MKMEGIDLEPDGKVQTKVMSGGLFAILQTFHGRLEPATRVMREWVRTSSNYRLVQRNWMEEFKVINKQVDSQTKIRIHMPIEEVIP